MQKMVFVYIHYNTNIEKASKILEEINHQGELISFNMQDKTLLELF